MLYLWDDKGIKLKVCGHVLAAGWKKSALTLLVARLLPSSPSKDVSPASPGVRFMVMYPHPLCWWRFGIEQLPSPGDADKDTSET